MPPFCWALLLIACHVAHCQEMNAQQQIPVEQDANLQQVLDQQQVPVEEGANLQQILSQQQVPVGEGADLQQILAEQRQQEESGGDENVSVEPDSCEGQCQTKCYETGLHCQFIAEQIPVLCENTEKICRDNCAEVCNCVASCGIECDTSGSCEGNCFDDCFDQQNGGSKDDEESIDEIEQDEEVRGMDLAGQEPEKTTDIPVVYKTKKVPKK